MKKKSLLEQLSDVKKIPLEFLKGLGISDTTSGSISIPYRLMDGTMAKRQRLRIGLSAKDGFRWSGDSINQIVPYGLDRVSQKKYTILVEGESDCWTLWFHGLPALGIPGATNQKTIMFEHIKNIDTIYCWHEPDDAGNNFISGTAKRMFDLGWSGELIEIKLEGIKDPSALHSRDSNEFNKIMRYCMFGGVKVKRYIPQEKKKIRSMNSGLLTRELIEKAANYLPENIVESKNKMIRCPVHKNGKEEKESMSIKRGFFYCFACGASLNSIQYVRLTQGVSFADAVRMLQ